MDNNSNILFAENITKVFGGTHALKGVDFSMERGEIHGLIGENGAGKSTLIKVIAGYYLPEGGNLYIDNQPVSIQKPADSLKHGIRVISQEFNLMNDVSVAENICVGNFPTKSFGIVDKEEMNERAQKIIDRLGEDIDVTRILGTLTVAQQQIVEIAKSLWEEPKILIMDEPTAALNDQETEHLFKVLKELKAAGVSIIFITHRMQEQFELADRITVMRDGNIIGTIKTKDATTDQLITMMVGKEIGETYQKRGSKVGDVIFEARNISVGKQIRNFSLNVRKGEIVSVFGLLGQGQETLGKALIGDVKIDQGQLLFDNKPIHLSSPQDAKKHKIGYVSDNRKIAGIFPYSTTGNNITISALRDFATGGFINTKKEQVPVDNLISKFGIRCVNADQLISSLSGGNQQKALIARWLANNSKVIILNMPTRGVDIGAKYDIYEILEELCDQGVGVLIISIELTEVIGLSNRIYIIRDGEIAGEYKAEEANQDSLMECAIGHIGLCDEQKEEA